MFKYGKHSAGVVIGLVAITAISGCGNRNEVAAEPEPPAAIVDPQTPVTLPEQLTAGKVLITGIAKVGNDLTATPYGFNPVPASYDYTWYRGYQVVGHGQVYRQVAADAGKTLTVQVDANYTGQSGLPGAVASASVDVSPELPTPSPSIPATVKPMPMPTVKPVTPKPTPAPMPSVTPTVPASPKPSTPAVTPTLPASPSPAPIPSVEPTVPSSPSPAPIETAQPTVPADPKPSTPVVESTRDPQPIPTVTPVPPTTKPVEPVTPAPIETPAPVEPAAPATPTMPVEPTAPAVTEPETPTAPVPEPTTPTAPVPVPVPSTPVLTPCPSLPPVTPGETVETGELAVPTSGLSVGKTLLGRSGRLLRDADAGTTDSKADANGKSDAKTDKNPCGVIDEIEEDETGVAKVPTAVTPSKKLLVTLGVKT